MPQEKPTTRREKLLKILRNAYFWLVVGNFAYSFFGMYTAFVLTAIDNDMNDRDYFSTKLSIFNDIFCSTDINLVK